MKFLYPDGEVGAKKYERDRMYNSNSERVIIRFEGEDESILESLRGSSESLFEVVDGDRTLISGKYDVAEVGLIEGAGKSKVLLEKQLNN